MSRKSGGGRNTSANVGKIDRSLSALAGGALIYRGLARGSAAGVAAAIAGGGLLLRAVTGHSTLYEKLRVTSGSAKAKTVDMEATVTVNREPGEVYSYWRNFENHPRFTYYLDAVTQKGGRVSHWKFRGPGDATLEWDAEVTSEEVGKSIAWESLKGSDLHHAGEARFEPATGNRGTAVRVRMHFRPPGGILVTPLNPLLEVLTENQLRADLLRFRQLVETGEIATTTGQPSGRREEQP